MSYAEFGPAKEVEARLNHELGPIIGEFEITQVPEGGAPEKIRTDWVGAKLPFRTYGLEGRSHIIFDEIRQLPIENLEQVAIFGLDAIVALRKLKRNQAADWWIESGHGFATLVFRQREGDLTIFTDSTEV